MKSLVFSIGFLVGSLLAPYTSSAIVFSSQDYKVIVTSFNHKNVWVQFENRRVKFSRDYVKFKPFTGVQQIVSLPKTLCELNLNKRVCKKSEA